MKNLILAFIILALTGCVDLHKHIKEDHEIVVIDGCEYVTYSSGESGYMAHKGNCKNH